MYDIAIIASALKNREVLLRRSLFTWALAVHYSRLNAVIGITAEGWDAGYLAKEYSLLNLQIETRPLSGSHIAGYNYWTKQLDAKVYFYTHPEILFPRDTVQRAYAVNRDEFLTFKAFWLPEYMTDNLEHYQWVCPEKLEYVNDLYKYDRQEKGAFYANRGIRTLETWEATVSWAMQKETVAKIFPFEDFGVQGPDDPWMAGARAATGIQTQVVRKPILFHQWHPQTWDGDEETAVRLAQKALRRRFG